MRLPVSKIYRAFPELDRFTDEQCERLLLRARVLARLGESDGCSTMLVLVGAVILLLIGGIALLEVFESTRIARFVRRGDWMESPIAHLGITSAIVAGAVLSLRARDRSLERAIRDQIRRTTCPTCCGSLLGCERSADSLRCGSCEAVFTFYALGLRSEDLGPSLIVLDVGTKCSGCSYIIAGLPIHRGFVTCPECSHRTPVVQSGDPLRTDPPGAGK